MPFVQVAHKHTRIIFIIFDLAYHWISQTDCWSVVKLNFFLGLLLLDGGPAYILLSLLESFVQSLFSAVPPFRALRVYIIVLCMA